MSLVEFVTESNRIEGIYRDPTSAEIKAHEDFLALSQIRVEDVEVFVSTCAGASLRDRRGMDVIVGDHRPPQGGPEIRRELEKLLRRINRCSNSPFTLHCDYETLHPFRDGNGRSGRALWAWQCKRMGLDPFTLGFLHIWYYDSLQAGRGIDDGWGHWFAGFVDGEGCFDIREKACRFTLAVRGDDHAVIYDAAHRLEHGSVGVLTARGAGNPQARLRIETQAGCLRLVDILDKYPLRAKKARDYQIWRSAVLWWTDGSTPGRTRNWDVLKSLREQLYAIRQYDASAEAAMWRD